MRWKGEKGAEIPKIQLCPRRLDNFRQIRLVMNSLYVIVFYRRYNFILFFDASCGFLTDVIIILLYSDSFTVSLNIKDSHFSTSRNKASYIVCCLSCLAVLLYFWIMQVYALFNLMKKKSKRKTSYFKDAIAWYSRRHFCKLGVIFSSTCYLFTGFN